MADAKKPEVEATVVPPPKNKSKLMLFIGIGVICLLLAGGGAFFLLKKNAPVEGQDAAEGPAHEDPVKKRTDHGALPIFYKFDKAFTVKLQSEQQDVYLQAEVQLKLQVAHDQDLIKQFEPELKHRMTLALMSKQAADLGAATGVQRLANELRDVANTVVGSPPIKKRKTAVEADPGDDADPGAPVQSVLFSSFIVQ